MKPTQELQAKYVDLLEKCKEPLRPNPQDPFKVKRSVFALLVDIELQIKKLVTQSDYRVEAIQNYLRHFEATSSPNNKSHVYPAMEWSKRNDIPTEWIELCRMRFAAIGMMQWLAKFPHVYYTGNRVL